MNVPMIEMPQAEAKQAFENYRELLKRKHTAEDEAICKAYRRLAKGQKVIDVFKAMRQAGLDERKRPKLAIARADLERVWFQWRWGSRDCNFFKTRATGSVYRVAFKDLWTQDQVAEATLTAIVPIIPAQLRPTGSLSGYHILWEAEWETVPHDPILLRHLTGHLYVVLAQWDLTPVEQAVLWGR